MSRQQHRRTNEPAVGSDSRSGAKRASRVVLYLAWLALPPVFADCPSPGGNPNNDCTSQPAAQSENTPDAGAGNPIDVRTGNRYQREVDLAPLPGTLPIEIVRHYNSQSQHVGALGYGWSHSFDAALFVSRTDIQIRQADGRRIHFVAAAGAPSAATESVGRPSGRQQNPPTPTAPATATTFHARNPEDGWVILTQQGHDWHWRTGRVLSFDTHGKLARIAEPSGHAIALTYDRDGRLFEIADSQSRKLTFGYYPNNRVKLIVDPGGQSFRYAYDQVGNLESVTYPDKAKRTYHYEDKHDPHNLTGITDERGIRVATYAYDRRDRAILSTHANNVNKVTLDYRAGLTILANSQGNKTRYTLDRNHRVLSVAGPGCATCGETNVSYRYNPAGQLTRTTRPTTTSRMDYDGRGRLVQVSEIPVGTNAATAGPNAATAGPNATTAGPNVMAGTNVGWVSDAPASRNPSRARSNSHVHVTRYEYGNARYPFLPTRVIEPSVIPGRTRAVELRYTDAGQVAAMTMRGFAPALADSRGAPTPIARTTLFRYRTERGISRLSEIDGPLPNGPKGTPADSDITRFEYARNGTQPVAVTLPAGLRTRVAYDAHGRVASTVAADGLESRYAYDPRGRLVQRTHAGRTDTLRYDAGGELIEAGTAPAAQSRGEDGDNHYRARARLGYDDAGRNTWIASHLGMLERFTYDTENNLIGRAERSARMHREESFRYDAAGRRIEHIDPNGAATRASYDAAGRMAAVTDPLERLRQYRYDAIGNLASVTDAANTPYAAVIRFGYDGFGRAESVRAPNGAVTRYVTDDFGQRRATISANSGETQYTYDDAGRLIVREDATGNRVAYRRDPAGRIIAMTEWPAGGGRAARTTVYRFAGDRLAEVIGPESRERYGYDRDGRVSMRTVTLRLESGAQASYVTRYAYDFRTGSLKSETRPDGGTIHYRYDGQGQLVALDWQRNRVARVQPLVTGMERDLIGLRYFRYGNGIEAHFERSKEGALARIRYRRPELSEIREASTIERLFGISPANAAEADRAKRLSPPGVRPQPRQQDAASSVAPGALSLPEDPLALLDHRYLYDAGGNVLLDAETQHGSNERYAYDPQDRLIQALRTSRPVMPGARGGATVRKVANTPASLSVARYFYDTTGNRLLAQEGVTDLRDFGRTQRVRYESGTSRIGEADDAAFGRARLAYDRVPSDAIAMRHDAAGRPVAAAARGYVYDAFGRLTEVRENGTRVARYRYDHAGRRIAKSVFPSTAARSGAGAASAAKILTTHFLHDARKLIAELDARGNIVRQYVYLGDQPIAVLDSPAGTPPARVSANAAGAWLRDAAAWLRDAVREPTSVAWLHVNHLGAPELVTDAKARPIWAAHYAPFGAISFRASAQPSFVLSLRLPGQYEDAETGLYYNDHRYYDPRAGRYLTPDPLGLRAGINSYAYAASNPLRFIDPSGLILFAFDGTNNGRERQGVDDWSNVYKFYLAYDQTENGRAWYMNGVGLDDLESGIQTNWRDPLDANTARERVDYMLGQLDQYMDSYTPDPENEVYIDIVGFSRGAAMGRDFANRVAERMRNKRWSAKTGCVKINFMGLWDTVAQFGFDGALNGLWQLDIPAEAQNVFQAVALNEHRRLFPGESIGRGIQLGFIGSHADVGGGYGSGDLSDVALNWIYEQARASDIVMKTWGQDATDTEWGVVSNPLVHDKNTNGGDRKFCLRKNNEIIPNNCQMQKETMVGGMTWSMTADYISRYTTPTLDADGESPIVGEVRMEDYAQWLKASYAFDIRYQ
jgi:RHS repeat-associated protein